MRLRVRVTLVLLLVNAGILGALAAWAWLDESQREADEHRRRARLEEQVKVKFTARFDQSDAGDIGAMLDWPLWEEFEAALLVDRRMLKLDGVAVPVRAVLNPLGSRFRPDDFPLGEITQALEQATSQTESVPVAGGLAMPLVTHIPFSNERSIWGGVYVKLPPLPATLPLWMRVLLAAGASTLLGGFILHRFLGRALLRPVEGLVATVHSFGAEQKTSPLPEEGSQEIRELLNSINTMMARIQGFQAELQEEVDRATTRASEAERRAARQDRLAAMGTLAAGLAHEINSPLAGALQGLETLRVESHSPRAQKHGNLTRDALHRIQELVQKLLDLAPARVESGECSLQKIWQDLPIFLGHRLFPHQLHTPSEPLEIFVRGNLGDLFPVFLNLVQNALDALDEDEATREKGGEIKISAEVDGQFVRIQIVDNGPGVNPAILPHLFEPFVTSKGVGEGTGLGLALAYATVGQLGGTMEAGNLAAGGFEVRLSLPHLLKNA